MYTFQAVLDLLINLIMWVKILNSKQNDIKVQKYLKNINFKISIIITLREI